jgi:hypothetical protein
MGVLDDAIREHLDLKRARGGDPADIERMEREALGPVRREPTIGSGGVGALDEQPTAMHESALHEDHLADLEELQEQGYHDSTAPHPHAHPEQPGGAHHAPAGGQFGLDHADSSTDAPEQPRRRFLRRNRPSEETLPAPGFPDDRPDFDPLAPGPIGGHDPLDYHEPLVDHEPLAHAEPPVEPMAQAAPPIEPFATDEPAAHDAPLEHPTAQEQAVSPMPPHLQFEHPPKRPRFSAEPPELQGAPVEPTAAPAPAEPEENDDVEVQETTEFDVQKHIAETRHQPDELPPASSTPPPAASTPPPPAASTPPPPPASAPPGAPAPPVQPGADQPEEDEDVLEETPEFLQDTPEHDRLWFEQRPPKDFDFDG